MDKDRITIYIEKETKRAIKIFCAKTDMSLSEVTEKAIKEFLERNPKK